MRELTYEQFMDRTMAIQRATGIFVDTGLTNNITHAFAAYQAIFAERERDIFINFQNYPTSDLEAYITLRYQRIKCPDCNSDFMFRVVDGQEVKTQLVCSNRECDTSFDSPEPLAWWMSQLKLKDGERIPLKEGEMHVPRITKRVKAVEEIRRRARTQRGRPPVRASLRSLRGGNDRKKGML